MKQITSKSSRCFQLAFSSAVLFAGVAIATPAATAAAAAASTQTAAPATGIDGLIAHLHSQLKITPAQEDLWNNVAQVMRDNASQLDTLVKARSDSAKTATAVDDLKAYEAISAAHEEGTKKLIPVFQALYDSMSDDQKKAADTEFREHGHRGHMHKAK